MSIRTCIDAVNRFLAYIKRNQVIQPGPGIVKVNVGCGMSVADGWINIDGSLNAFASTWPTFVLTLLHRFSGSRRWFSQTEYISILRNHRFVHHEVRYGLPLPDASTDYVYSSHFLEHLHEDDGKRFVSESYRLLKPGGVIRILVPDLEDVMNLYRDGQKEEAMRAFFSDSAGVYGQHHYLYDFDMLSRLLTSAGFSRVVRPPYREGAVPDVETLDGRPGSLIVEATK
jgi:predicted SAM-dependent methyltransferase